jgi:hypothetical protein
MPGSRCGQAGAWPLRRLSLQTPERTGGSCFGRVRPHGNAAEPRRCPTVLNAWNGRTPLSARNRRTPRAGGRRRRTRSEGPPDCRGRERGSSATWGDDSRTGRRRGQGSAVGQAGPWSPHRQRRRRSPFRSRRPSMTGRRSRRRPSSWTATDSPLRPHLAIRVPRSAAPPRVGPPPIGHLHT